MCGGAFKRVGRVKCGKKGQKMMKRRREQRWTKFRTLPNQRCFLGVTRAYVFLLLAVLIRLQGSKFVVMMERESI